MAYGSLKSLKVFGTILSLACAISFAADAPAGAGKAAAPGAVGENAISADADSHCAKAQSDCPKAADCPKGAACHKRGHGLKSKGAKAKAAPALETGAAVAKPAETEKTAAPK